MPLKFGAEMGRAFPAVRGGVPFYSSHYDSADYSERHEVKATLPDNKTVLTGLGAPHQCVGGARSALVHLYATTFASIPMAYHIFQLPTFERILPAAADSASTTASSVGSRRSLQVERIPTVRCENGEAPASGHEIVAKPLPGMLLIWNAGGFFEYTGHVAIITAVIPRCDKPDGTPGKRYGVQIAEANYDDEKWANESYSRELPAVINERGHFFISEPAGGRVKGWIAGRHMVEEFECPHTSPTFSESSAARSGFAGRKPDDGDAAKQQKQKGAVAGAADGTGSDRQSSSSSRDDDEYDDDDDDDGDSRGSGGDGADDD